MWYNIFTPFFVFMAWLVGAILAFHFYRDKLKRNLPNELIFDLYPFMILISLLSWITVIILARGRWLGRRK